jgi:hypothetical protein
MRPPGFSIAPGPNPIEFCNEKVPIRGVVAIPVKDEAERIDPCLEALAVAHRFCDSPDAPFFGVVLLLNNCTDKSAEIVRSFRPTLPFPIRILEEDFPPAEAHAGSARRVAMDAATHWLETCGRTDGIILTTDADSRVPRDWIQANFRAIERGAEAVAGAIVPLMPMTKESFLWNCAVAAISRQLTKPYWKNCSPGSTRSPTDPWPRHATNSGASFALTVASYRKIGGVLAVPLGEDKALAAQLFACDARLRHDPGIVVVTSGRLVGRAKGGVADTMALRTAMPESVCDEFLEPVVSATLRGMWRKNIRQMHQDAQLQTTDWPSQLGTPTELAACVAFSFAWVWSVSSILPYCLTASDCPFSCASLPIFISARLPSIAFVMKLLLEASLAKTTVDDIISPPMARATDKVFGFMECSWWFCYRIDLFASAANLLKNSTHLVRFPVRN